MTKRQSKVRRSFARLRRSRAGGATGPQDTGPQDRLAPQRPTTALARTSEPRQQSRPNEAPNAAPSAVGWDLDERDDFAVDAAAADDTAPLPARILSLLSDPRIPAITEASAARLLGEPKTDVQNALESLVAAGELVSTRGPNRRYGVPPERKAQLEALFRDAAQELGESTALVRMQQDTTLAQIEEDEEPRLPVTAGLLSLFLPGTGQLLNGDVGRASLVFAVWSLALLTSLPPIWTFVALYAGAEAFFTAKIRSMERKLALEAAPAPAKAPQPLKPA